MKALREREVPEEELLELTWRQAKDLEQDRERPVFDHDEALAKRAAHFRKQLYKALGNRPVTDPEAFAKALLDCDRRLPTWLMETVSWSEPLEELMELRRQEAEQESDY